MTNVSIFHYIPLGCQKLYLLIMTLPLIKTICFSMEKLRRETAEADSLKKKKELSEGPNPSFGYGGKFGIEKDRMDQSAVGHDYTPKLEKHVSQKDYSVGFGGKFGIQTDRIDKVTVNICNFFRFIPNSNIIVRALLIGITRKRLKNTPRRKITAPVSVVNSEYKLIGKINPPSDGIIGKKSTSTNRRKVKFCKPSLKLKGVIKKF